MDALPDRCAGRCRHRHHRPRVSRHPERCAAGTYRAPAWRARRGSTRQPRAKMSPASRTEGQPARCQAAPWRGRGTRHGLRPVPTAAPGGPTSARQPVRSDAIACPRRPGARSAGVPWLRSRRPTWRWRTHHDARPRTRHNARPRSRRGCARHRSRRRRPWPDHATGARESRLARCTAEGPADGTGGPRQSADGTPRRLGGTEPGSKSPPAAAAGGDFEPGSVLPRYCHGTVRRASRRGSTAFPPQRPARDSPSWDSCLRSA